MAPRFGPRPAAGQANDWPSSFCKPCAARGTAADGCAGRTLFHSNTELLIDHWRELARDGRAPGRRALDPGRLPKLVPQLLMLGRDGPGDYRIRLTGALVVQVHRRGETLVGRDGLGGWGQDDRLSLRAALEQARRRCQPVVVRADALWGPVGVQLEMMFAPLAGDDGGPERVLGFYQPLAPLPTASNLPPPQFVLRRLEHLEPPAGVTPRLRLAALDGRTVA